MSNPAPTRKVDPRIVVKISTLENNLQMDRKIKIGDTYRTRVSNDISRKVGSKKKLSRQFLRHRPLRGVE